MPHREGDDARNVLLNEMNKPFAEYALDGETMKKWDYIIKTRDAVNVALEQARNEKKIGKGLEAKVILTVTPAELDNLDNEELADLFIVSQTERREGDGNVMTVVVEPADGEKCQRCWKVLTAVGTVKEHPALCPRCAAVVAKLPAEE